MNRGDIMLAIDRCNAHDLPDVADLLASLDTQLEASHKREAMLREELEEVATDLMCGKAAHLPGRADKAAKRAIKVLSETNDLDGYVLCKQEDIDASLKREVMLRETIDRYGHGPYCTRRIAFRINPNTDAECCCYMKDILAEIGN